MAVPPDDALRSAEVTEVIRYWLAALRFEEAGMNLHVLDQPHSTHAWERGGVLTQYVRLEPDYSLSVVSTIESALRWAPGPLAEEAELRMAFASIGHELPDVLPTCVPRTAKVA